MNHATHTRAKAPREIDSMSIAHLIDPEKTALQSIVLAAVIKEIEGAQAVSVTTEQEWWRIHIVQNNQEVAVIGYHGGRNAIVQYTNRPFAETIIEQIHDAVREQLNQARPSATAAAKALRGFINKYPDIATDPITWQPQSIQVREYYRHLGSILQTITALSPVAASILFRTVIRSPNGGVDLARWLNHALTIYQLGFNTGKGISETAETAIVA